MRSTNSMLRTISFELLILDSPYFRVVSSAGISITFLLFIIIFTSSSAFMSNPPFGVGLGFSSISFSCSVLYSINIGVTEVIFFPCAILYRGCSCFTNNYPVLWDFCKIALS